LLESPHTQQNSTNAANIPPPKPSNVKRKVARKSAPVFSAFW
jgi:hypothetical protein